MTYGWQAEARRDRVISSTSNNKVKHVRRLQRDRRFRQEEQEFVVEGTRWLQEISGASRQPRWIFFTGEWRSTPQEAELLESLEAPTYRVSEGVMAVMSDLETPPGILAVLPREELAVTTPRTLLLILDRIRNPGNMGTILRTAAAAGVDALILGPGCVDPYNPKVIRGGMGAHLRLPLRAMSWKEINGETQEMTVWLATADGAIPYTGVNWRQPAALIIGSEASGPGPEAREIAGDTLYIPMHSDTESLNAAMAAGIILFEAMRQRRT